MSSPRSELQKTLDWLLTEGRRAANVGELLVGLIRLLRDYNLPIDRATLGAPLLHPIAQSSFCAWDPENGLSQNFLLWDEAGLSQLKNSPMYAIYKMGEDTDWHLESDEAAERFSVGPGLREVGFTHYLAFALPFADGSFKALTVQTKKAEGFSKDQIAFLKSLIVTIAAAAEHHIQRSLSETLMNTFVGERAGTRVLDGQVHRGDGEFIQAVIWMCDLKGFTSFAASREPNELLDALNVYFDVVSDAIMSEGGEALKFIGDAVLGIFPISKDNTEAVSCAERAVDKVLASKNDEIWPEGLEFGIGLHSGEVFYGNIGSKTRLDFTVIGQAVNLVSRIEALCREFHRPVIVSEEIASQSYRSYELMGERMLKGFKDPIAVFAVL